MRELIRSVVTGRYDAIGDPADADCVIGHSFGTRPDGPGPVNELLARFILERTNEQLPLLLQEEVADALGALSRRPVLAIRGEASTTVGSKLDSWDVFRRARPFLDERGLGRPLLVAQAFHVRRVAWQAARQGLHTIVPAGLPRDFDPDSTQPWTRHAALWVPREIVGLTYLRVRGRV